MFSFLFEFVDSRIIFSLSRAKNHYLLKYKSLISSSGTFFVCFKLGFDSER